MEPGNLKHSQHHQNALAGELLQPYLDVGTGPITTGQCISLMILLPQDNGYHIITSGMTGRVVDLLLHSPKGNTVTNSPNEIRRSDTGRRRKNKDG